VATYQRGAAAGIGFTVTEDDPYTGIDLDSCIDGAGEIATWAEKLVRRFNSYTEKTPSRTGLRILVKGKLPKGRNRLGKIELYDQRRYFTVTGWHLEDTPATIEERQGELLDLYRELFGSEEQQIPTSRPSQPWP